MDLDKTSLCEVPKALMYIVRYVPTDEENDDEANDDSDINRADTDNDDDRANMDDNRSTMALSCECLSDCIPV